MNPPRRTFHARVAASSILACLALSACGQEASPQASSVAADEAPAAGASTARNGLDSASTFSVQTATDEQQATPPQESVGQTYLIKTGQAYFVARDVEKLLEQVRRTLERSEATVASESSFADNDGVLEEATVQVRIPVEEFNQTLDALRELPGLRDASSEVTDVTEAVVDTQTRLVTLRTSLKRLRAFVAQTENLNELLGFERRLTEVESDIARLTQQRDQLRQQASRSTLTITISRKAPPAPEPESQDGFASGLERGWDGLVDAAETTATATGMALPFAAVGAVLVTPLWLRRRHRKAVHKVSEAS